MNTKPKSELKFRYFHTCMVFMARICLLMCFYDSSFRVSEDDYVKAIKEEIRKVVKLQEEFDIDVLVHGEPEVNFSHQISFFTFTCTRARALI